MQNIFRNLDANAPSHMNAYDLTQRHIMSTKVGLKNVVCALDCMPKDYFEVDVLSLIRSMPINTAAFSRLKVNFEAVFVPYQQLWHGWNQFYLQTEERMSVGDSFDHTQLPCVSFNSILKVLYDCAFFDGLLEGMKVDYLHDNPRLLDKLPSGSTVMDAIALQVYSDYAQELTIYHLYDEMGYSRGWNIVRFLDQLGYGSLYSVYKGAINDMVYSLDFEDAIDYNEDGSVDIASTVQSISHHLEDAGFDMPYLSLLVGESTSFLRSLFPQREINFGSFIRQWSFAYTYVESMVDDKPVYVFNPIGVKLNVFRALAYQKAYQDYTLNKRQEAYDPTYFNVDSVSEVTDYDVVCKVFSFRYDAWDYDLFTGVFNNPQTGDVSILNNNVSLLFKPETNLPASGGNYGQFAVGKRDGMLAGQEYPIEAWRPGVNGEVVGTFVSKPAVSVYDIKRAEFLQRWKENHLRAGNKLQNQAVGQWNTRFRYLSDEYSDYIGSWDMFVDIEEVINTANNQGDISGKGIGASNGKFTYRTNDAGVILIMVSIKPRAEYDALMIDRQNTCLEIGDFPSPFFDNLGLESVPMYLLSQNTLPANRTQSLGYTVRYASWKTAVDKVHGSFMSYGYRPADNGSGSLAIWATPRKELESISVLQDISRIFYVNPNVVDSIFGVEADGTLESDHFNLNCNVICKVIRNLSVSGQLMFGL